MTWSCTYCMPCTRLRIRFAFGGMVMSSASSTARHDATAWTTVQTPQIRWVKAQASRGSRPCITISMPRNWVEVAHALAIRPFSAWASIRRCPSIRVMGSTTTRVLAMVPLLPGTGRSARPGRRLAGAADHGKLPRAAPLADLVDAGGHGVSADPCRRSDRQRGPQEVDPAFDAEPSDVGQPIVERRHRVPEIGLGAADAGMPGADRPAGPGVPLEDRAGREGGGPLASHLIEAPPLPGRFVVELLDELAGVEVGAAGTLVVNARTVGEQWAPLGVELGQPIEGQDSARSWR